ncbi:MAG TPA: T9SS type A sorting domain-containing protein [Chitinophagales bacterium]|nr:T9SS type A sorting domain-containing protein [Chitinophagales bacterium]
MNRLSTIIFLFTIINLSSAWAQCSFTPTVIPSQPILCPNATDTLWTQEYESYQWYKGNNAIAGATNQYQVVTQDDVLKQFKVKATLEGCTETSAAVLVDGWVFLLPFVIQSGDMGTFDPNTQSFVLCPGDIMILEMGQPYIENVQWFDNGIPIPGATGSIYQVTSPGSFTACGAPATCPDYQDCMLIPIDVQFSSTPKPVITLTNDTLFSTSAGSYKWYFNGNLIPGATSIWYEPVLSGSYVVAITDNYSCSVLSEPFEFIATGTLTIGKTSFSFSLFPNPAHEYLTVLTSNASADALITITDVLGRVVSKPVQYSSRSNSMELDIKGLPAGNYLVRINSNGHIAFDKLVIY